jgi:hypothetical protein
MPNAKPIEPITCRECEFTATCWCSFEARDFKARTGLCKICAAARGKMSASCKTNSTPKPAKPN